MTATGFPPRRPGGAGRVPPRRTTTLRPRRRSAGGQDAGRADRARMEEAAVEAGRWLRRTGRHQTAAIPRGAPPQARRAG
ncbi:MAG TPA: hypothetical protein VGH67_13515 [Solirubrobacteraceae bacterium]